MIISSNINYRTRMDKFEHRSVIKFLTLKGLEPNQIIIEMQSVYGNDAPSLSTIKRWNNEFKRGRQSLLDDERSGRPPTSTNEDKIQAVEELVNNDRRLRIANIAHILGISCGSVHEILHQHLGFNKVSARWVPKMLKPDQRATRVALSTQLLDRYNLDRENFEKRIITGDECWIYFYDPETKRDSMEWRRGPEGAPRKFKQQRSVGKVLGCFFWDSQGLIMREYLEPGPTVSGVRYAQQLRDLRSACVQKRRGKMCAGPLLLHDNAPAHTSQLAIRAAARAGYEILQHPPYSPDLAPSDFFYFIK